MAKPRNPHYQSTITDTLTTAWRQFDQFKNELVRVHFWIVAVITAVQPYAVGWFDTTNQLPTSTWSFYWTVLRVTAPLTISMVIWTCLLIACWPNDSEGAYLWVMCLLGGGMLTAAAHIGNAMGATQVKLVEFVKGAPWSTFLNPLLSYLLAYRGTLFVSSLGIAAYAGIITYRIVLHRSIADESSAIGHCDSDEETEHRRAA